MSNLCSQESQPTQKLNGAAIDYGATAHVSNNPFAASAMGSMIEENVQPEARDDYLHGSVADQPF